MYFWKGPNLKTCKFHWKLQCIWKVGQNNQTWNWALKLSKNGFKNVCSKIIEFGIKICSKIAPGGLPGRSQSLPRQLLGSFGRLQAVSVSPVWLHRASLMSPWLPLGTASMPPRAIWEPRDPKYMVLGGFGTRFSIQNWEFITPVSNIYYPFLLWICFFIRLCFHGFPCY